MSGLRPSDQFEGPNWADPDERYLTRDEKRDLSQTRDDACTVCNLIHAGECE